MASAYKKSQVGFFNPNSILTKVLYEEEKSKRMVNYKKRLFWLKAKKIEQRMEDLSC